MSYVSKNVSLKSKVWQAQDKDGITGRFLKVGFTSTGEILNMKVFDLLNIYSIDSRKAMLMILRLYEFFNWNESVDREMELGFLRQYFSYPQWKKKHKSLSLVTVADLVLTEDINRKAIMHFYEGIVRQFYKSAEYDNREYRYLSYIDFIAGICCEEDEAV